MVTFLANHGAIAVGTMVYGIEHPKFFRYFHQECIIEKDESSVDCGAHGQRNFRFS